VAKTTHKNLSYILKNDNKWNIIVFKITLIDRKRSSSLSNPTNQAVFFNERIFSLPFFIFTGSHSLFILPLSLSMTCTKS